MRYDVEKVKNCHDFIFFWRQSENVIDKGVFSQWYNSPFTDGVYYYNSAEQYMMAQKAILMGDQTTLMEILNETNPRQIKSLGRKVKNFDENLWNKEKYNVVLYASLLKFSQNQQLCDYLLSTGNKVLVEASPYDSIWGIKMLETDRGVTNPLNWKGENLLGFALMEARDIIRIVRCI